METAVITPDIGGVVWLKCIRYPFLNRPLDCPNHDDLVRAARLGLFEIKGRSFPVGVSDLRNAPAFTLTTITRTLEQARDFDLIMAAGETMLVQVPHEVAVECGRVLAVPGGYVEIANVVQHRATLGSQIYQWTLPCQVVAPPGPDVIGTLMTWGTVFNLYGNWTSLIAANPTWDDLLQTVGSPDDLVVL